jgi:hypothetical protein
MLITLVGRLFTLHGFVLTASISQVFMYALRQGDGSDSPSHFLPNMVHVYPLGMRPMGQMGDGEELLQAG